MIFHYRGKVDSTNNWAKNYTKTRHFHIFYTGYQTKGKGRLHRKWESSPNANVLMTILHPSYQLCNPPWFAGLVASYTIINILNQYHINALYKWPNDVWTYRGKIAGILPETVIHGNEITSLLVGIGLNVNEKYFPNTLQASSMLLENGQLYNTHKLTRLIAQKYVEFLNISHIQIINYLWEKFIWKNKEIIILPEQITGIAKSLDQEGNLIIEKDGKYLTIRWGELSIREL